MNKILTKIRGLILKPPAPPAPEPAAEEGKEPEYDWQYLVTQGHVVAARINSMRYVGWRLLIVLAITGYVFHQALDLAGGAVNVASRPALEQHESRPSINANAISRGSRSEQLVGELTPAADLPAYIAESLSGLRKNGKLPYPCVRSEAIAEAWVGPDGDINYPLCNPQAAGNGAPQRIYAFALIKSQAGIQNWMGVFIHEPRWLGLQREWVYKNIGLERFHQVDGSDVIEAGAIVNTLQADFRDLPVVGGIAANIQNEGVPYYVR